MAASLKTLRARLEVRSLQSPEHALDTVRAALRAFDNREMGRDRVLDTCNTALDGHGVECIRDPRVDDGRTGPVLAEYVNMGDTYACTILFSHRTKTFYVCSWGDWYERSPECRAYYRACAREERYPRSPRVGEG